MQVCLYPVLDEEFQSSCMQTHPDVCDTLNRVLGGIIGFLLVHIQRFFSLFHFVLQCNNITGGSEQEGGWLAMKPFSFLPARAEEKAY